MAKGGAATGKKRERFVQHRELKKTRKRERFPESSHHHPHKAAPATLPATTGRIGGPGSTTTARKHSRGASFKGCEAFLQNAEVADLEAVVRRCRGSDEADEETADLLEEMHGITLISKTRGAATAQEQRRRKRDLVADLKRRCATARPKPLEEWLLTAWAACEAPQRALAFEWTTTDDEAVLALDAREVRGRDGSVALFKYLADHDDEVPVLALTTDDGSTAFRLKLERNQAGDLRLRGTRTSPKSEDPPRPVLTRPLLKAYHGLDLVRPT